MAGMSYVGSVISNFLVGFIIVVITLSIFFIPLSCILLWQFIYEHMWIWLTVLITDYASGFIMDISKSFAATGSRVLNKPLFCYLDLKFFYTGIFSGFVSAITRYFYAICVLLFGSSRIDQPLLPTYILNIYMFDNFHKNYMSALLLFHNHNHPVLFTILYRLSNIFL